jgi:MFS family permease
MRRLVLVVYALVFVTELCQSAIIPLLPTFGRELDLSEVETGAVLAATTFATVLVAVPIGLAADRLGAHRLTAAAALVVVVASVVQGYASSFWMLLGGRALFGIAFAAVWTAGLSLIASSTSSRRAGALGGTIAVGGAAHLVGPLSAGFLADHVALALPFLLVAGAAAVTAALLALGPAPPVERPRRDTLGAAVLAARRHHELRTAVVVMALLGVVAGLVPLLVPLLLDENGLGASQIGVVFSAGAAVWIVASGAAARNAGRTVRTAVAGACALALGLVLVLPALSVATAMIALFIVLRAATHAPLSTISYPLAEVSARVSGIGSGTVIGLMNVVWGAAAAVTPVVTGALVEGVGARATFGLVGLSVSLAGLWILALTRRERLRMQAAETA